MFTAALQWPRYGSNLIKIPSTDNWIKKMWKMYTMRYYTATKKLPNFTICSDVNKLGACYV